MVSNPWHCLTYSLIIIPPLLLTTYFFASFPNPPQMLYLHPSLASLSASCKSWTIYPEDFYHPGNYVTLPHGRVRYWLLGPEKGRKIVLIHGLSIPSLVWKEVASELVSRGYRVLLYDLYGRGYSDAPQTKYDSTLYVTQLALLMQHVKWEKAILMGVSMGGGIAASFVATFPQLVDDTVVLIASAGLMESTDLSRTAKFMSSPLVQSVTSSVLARKYLQRLADSSNSATNDSDPVAEIVRIQSAHLPGYNAALSSSLRDGPIRGLTSAFSSDAFKGRKVLIIHGTNDRTVPYKYAAKIQSLLPEGSVSKLVTVENGGHDLTLTAPQIILDAFDTFDVLVS